MTDRYARRRGADTPRSATGRHEAPGTWHPAPGTRHPARGTRHLALLRLSLCLTLLFAHAAAASARDFLWKATSKTGGRVYLVGSVHLLTQDFYPLSLSIDQAFKESDLLVEEVDLAEMLSPAAQTLMLGRGMLPANTSLDAVVAPATLALVAQRTKELGLPIEPLKRFKPWSLALMLTALEWQKAGFDAEIGIDRHFYDQAKMAGTPVQGLETVEYQIARFDELPMNQQDRLLAETMKDLDNEIGNLTTLVKAWKAGEVSVIEDLLLKDVKQAPLLYERLLVERNRNWMPAIEALFNRPRPAFVVVGAAHLVGPDGLVAQLKARGYRVEQM